MKINSEKLIQITDSYFSDYDKKVIYEVTGVGIPELIDDRLLRFGLVIIDIVKLDAQLRTPCNRSMRCYILEKFGLKHLDVIERTLKFKGILK